MPRPKRKEIKFTNESALSLMQEIYNECKKLIPNMKMPQGIFETPVKPTTFDFTRRDKLNVKIRDFSTTLKETIDWLKTNPFSEKIENE